MTSTMPNKGSVLVVALAGLVSLCHVPARAAVSEPAAEPPSVPLYAGEIPNSHPAPDEEKLRDPTEEFPFYENISRPTLTRYEPAVRDAGRAAVIILPGGSYIGVSIVKEGHNVARAFADMGVTAFVLKYRTPSDQHMLEKKRGPLQDVQQAIATVRNNAAQWQIDPRRIGVVGFSAGGHLAATSGTQFNLPVLPQWSSQDVRPDFLVLIYPVISLSDDISHKLSRKQLLGESPSASDLLRFSNEYNVTAETPPAFLVHAADDVGVPVGNSLRFFDALHAKQIPAQLMVYPGGGHGFGLNNPTTSDRWIERCREWLASQGWLAGTQAEAPELE